MLTKALVLTDGEADLLSRALEEVKTKTFEESQISLDDVGALNALVSHFRDAEKVKPDKEARQISVNPLSKRLFWDILSVEKVARTQRAARGRVDLAICPCLHRCLTATSSVPRHKEISEFTGYSICQTLRPKK
jgi:hypothetical protein